MKKSIWSKILSTVLILSMLVAMLPVTSFSAAAEAIGQAVSLSAIPDLDSEIEENTPDLAEVVAFAEGLTSGYGSNGKFLAPIEAPEPGSVPVSTRADLEAIGNDATSLSGKYHLVNDIDLDGAGWVPIGDNSTDDDSSRFTGIFDGQGHVIRNLAITSSTYQYIGFFGYADGAIIKNIGLVDAKINSSSSSSIVGGICADSSLSTIINCYYRGNIFTSLGIIVGGICGAYAKSITYCYNAGDISASSSMSDFLVGGISGFASGSITYCYNTGNVSVTARYSSVGGVCGEQYSTIHNCYNTGSISIYSYSRSMVGGITGYCEIPISHCFNTGDISGLSTSSISDVGGICGYNQSWYSSITKCYNTGDISSSSSSSSYASAGGICGYSFYSTISDCVVLSSLIYADNTDSADNIRKYLVGYQYYESYSNVNNLALEGIAGDPIDDANGFITRSQAKDQATYEGLGWDFDDIWQMVEGYAYPQLKGLPPAGLSTDATLASLTILDTYEDMLFPKFNTSITSHTVSVPYGIDKVIIEAEANHPGASISGVGEKDLPKVGEYSFDIKVTAEDGDAIKIYTITIIRQAEVPIDPSKFIAPIEPPDPNAKKIYTAQQLHNVRNDLSGSYILMNDIDLADWGEWEPIGDGYGNAFLGTFDGQGHIIKNLTMTGDTYQHVGLFGYAREAIFRNVGLERTFISTFSETSAMNIGTICAYCYSSCSIFNCYNSGDISSYSSDWLSFIGGICGRGGSISHCYNTGDISSSSNHFWSGVGGICGIDYGLISDCYNTGDICSASRTGGICGCGYTSISSCYNTGYISSSSYSGGICGRSEDELVFILNCYNTGDVYCSATCTGGVCGWYIGAILNCYNVGVINSSASFPGYSAGGICGLGSDGYSSVSNCVALFKQIESTNPDNSDIYLIGDSAIKTSNFALKDIAGDYIDDSSGRITQEQAEDQYIYETSLGWDFVDVWHMVPGYKYPQLQGLPPAGPMVDIKYTVNFEAGDHGTMDLDPASEKVGYDDTVTIVPSIEKRTGYIFVGWESSLGGIYDSEAVELYRVRADVTFTARYADAEKATVIFDYNDGKDIEGNSFIILSDYTGEEYEIPLPGKEGYDLAGWDPFMPGRKYGIKGVPERFIAKWDAKSYIVSFKAGEHGELDPSDRQEIVKYGERITLIPSVKEKTGFTFIGWESNLSHDFYRNNRLKNLPIMENITFTALCADAAKATVAIDYNGGVDEEGKHFIIISGKPGDPYVVPEFTLAGHTLSDWLPTMPNYIFSEEVEPTYYFAFWSANRYTVTFMDEDGSILGEIIDIGFGTKIEDGSGAIPDNPTKSGYDFAGWNDGVSTRRDISAYIVTSDVSFTAKYQLKYSGGPGISDPKPTTAILTVRAIDKATNKEISVQSTTVVVGKTEKIPAPIIPGYFLAEDCQPTQEVTIVAGNNTVDFFYNELEKVVPPRPGPGEPSEKVKSTLETVEHIQYINGYPDGSVKPDSNITRGEVAIIFWRLLKSPEKNDPLTAAFSDLKGDESYAQAVKYLAKIGILQGYEDGSFRPSRGITRAEFVTIACRFDDLANSNSNPFTDLAGSHWAYAYIISAHLKGWISGYPDGEFKPQNRISRAEAVKIVNRMLGRGIEPADLPADLPSYTDLTSDHWAYCEIIEATVSHQFERQEGGWEIWK